MRIAIGLTESDPETGYSSFDGYREGARQRVLWVDAPDDTVPATLEEIAEAVFEASNAPVHFLEESFHGHVQLMLVRQGARSVSVGDTVQVDDARVACASFGWVRV